jgi:DNA polymerase-3 subunit epsilon
MTRESGVEANEAEALAARLAGHPDYRVVRRLQAAERPALVSKLVRRAAVVDTETTGTDPATDKVIELAIVVFEYCAESGAVGRVVDRYDAFEDPGMPIPPGSTAIHGITDAMVRGHRLDEVAIGHLLEGVRLVIAHNARFDRVFLEQRLPVFATLPWGCSWQEVAWHDAGIESSKLEYLAYRYGFFYEGHRAEADCLALLEVLQRPFAPTGKPALAQLLESARRPSFRLWANNSAFETKDLLRRRGFRWDAPKRCWYCELPTREQVQSELAWLTEFVFARKSVALDLDEFDARTRYSSRDGKRERVMTS